MSLEERVRQLEDKVNMLERAEGTGFIESMTQRIIQNREDGGTFSSPADNYLIFNYKGKQHKVPVYDI